MNGRQLTDNNKVVKSLLPDLCVSQDVVFVREHWLTADFLFRMNSIAKDFVCCNMSSMDDAISGGVGL